MHETGWENKSKNYLFIVKIKKKTIVTGKEFLNFCKDKRHE
jgi:hypothetical protein